MRDFTSDIYSTPDIFSKMLKFCPVDATCQSNVDSVVVAELAICCNQSPSARLAESGPEGQRANGGTGAVKTHHMYKSIFLSLFVRRRIPDFAYFFLITPCEIV